jgi:hypothetical protein
MMPSNWATHGRRSTRCSCERHREVGVGGGWVFPSRAQEVGQDCPYACFRQSPHEVDHRPDRIQPQRHQSPISPAPRRGPPGSTKTGSWPRRSARSTASPAAPTVSRGKLRRCTERRTELGAFVPGAVLGLDGQGVEGVAYGQCHAVRHLGPLRPAGPRAGGALPAHRATGRDGRTRQGLHSRWRLRRPVRVRIRPGSPPGWLRKPPPPGLDVSAEGVAGAVGTPVCFVKPGEDVGHDGWGSVGSCGGALWRR